MYYGSEELFGQRAKTPNDRSKMQKYSMLIGSNKRSLIEKKKMI